MLEMVQQLDHIKDLFLADHQKCPTNKLFFSDEDLRIISNQIVNGVTDRIANGFHTHLSSL